MLDLARFFKGDIFMNFKTYKALNSKALELMRIKENNQLDYLSNPSRIDQELYDAKKQLDAYSKLFEISVFDFVYYFNNCGKGDYRFLDGCFFVDGISGVAVKVENLKLNVADFESQFEAKGEHMLTQDATFDYVLYDVKTDKKIAKLADGVVSMLTNSENLLFNEESAMQLAMEDRTMKHTKINLVMSSSPFAITTIFNKTSKHFSCKINGIDEKKQTQLNDAAWGVAQCSIDKKMDDKLSKLNAEIDDLKSKFGETRMGFFEAIK